MKHIESKEGYCYYNGEVTSNEMFTPDIVEETLWELVPQSDSETSNTNKKNTRSVIPTEGIGIDELDCQNECDDNGTEDINEEYFL